MADKLAQIKELTAKRGQAKGSITRIVSYIEQAEASKDTKISEASSRLDLLERAFQDFKEADSKLAALDCATEMIDIEDKYLQVKVKLKDFLADSSGNATVPLIEQFSKMMSHTVEQQNQLLSKFTSSLSTSLNQSFLNTSSEEPQFTARLPRLSVPIFTGEYKEFPSFKDLFSAAVHNKNYLSQAEKFQYLRGCLNGEPAELIKHFAISDANYQKAWVKVCERYEKQKYITNEYIKTFVDLPHMKEKSARTLRSLANVADQVTRGLEALGDNAIKRDPWLIYILLAKTDLDTQQAWALQTAEINYPSFESFLKFLNTRCDGLEPCEALKPQQSKYRFIVKSHNAIDQSFSNCPSCSMDHRLYECDKFSELDIIARREEAMKLNVCFNCLSATHKVNKCKSKRSCYKCGRRHHTMLHEAVLSNAASDMNSSTENESPIENISSTLTTTASSNMVLCSHAILPTALVKLRDKSGNFLYCNLLLDSGSQISLVSEETVEKSSLQRRNTDLIIGGLATSKVSAVGRTTIEISPRFDESNWLKMDVFILKQITTTASYDERCHLDKFDELKLADPMYLKGKPIDILMGADYFFQVLKRGKLFVAKDAPIAQETSFGWVVSGKTDHINLYRRSEVKSTHARLLEDRSLEWALERFWEQEEIQDLRGISEEEELCEGHFRRTVRRNEFGRFIVQLPFKQIEPKLGDTFKMAKRRLITMERKMNSNSEFGQLYRAFMKEYIDLNHMIKISPDSLEAEQREICYLPHHGVWKTSSDTTKLRVVFDGSCVSSSGVSLNSKLQVGPTVQSTLSTILLRFRTFPIAITADIEKMYRQILLEPTQTRYQRILWRFSSNQPIEHYQLMTVTYGLASASFLATRVLIELAENYERDYPEIAGIIRSNFYVDDLLTGATNEKEALKIKNDIDFVLKQGGFVLRKWKSNLASLTDVSGSIKITHDSDIYQVLGLHWQPKQDIFAFKVQIPEEVKCTKRSILSIASRLFDPLGWLTPFTVNIKILMQGLWFHKLSWDEELPSDLQGRWHAIKTQFETIKEVKIPRFMCPLSSPLEIHGFCDASENAYAAAIYIRTSIDGHVKTNLLLSKSKVAPIQQISIPRLELCGAHLLAKLVASVYESYGLKTAALNLWTDSTVVLSWLHGPPRKWKAYVGNRTSQIFQYVPNAVWRHVKSEDNPADLPSRGVSSISLMNNTLWWEGPKWLKRSENHWPQPIKVLDTHEEQRHNVLGLFTALNDHCVQVLLDKLSEWTRIIHIMARVKRFIYNMKNSRSKLSGWLTTEELQQAEILIFKEIQRIEFSDDIAHLHRYKMVKSNSRLISLAPFIDENGVLRVGGRLENATCSYDQKHPIILPKQHKISKLILSHLHIKYLHPGPTHLTSISRTKYWILGVREAARSICNKCIKCFKYATNKSSQLMGNLPSQRLVPARPFSSTGVDYAGPIMLATKRGRGAKLVKGYIVIFICLVTKALHIEVASDLTSESFLAVLKRFTARRGVPKQIFSDNGTNFIGAKKILSDIYRLLNSEACKQEVMTYAVNIGIKWSFIPPAAPNFGGIWERAVRSVKTHLVKVIGSSHLTFEEMSTVLAQIENVLNSRPLCAVTNEDTDNIDTLTPAHFLILGAAAMIPDNDYSSTPKSYLTRWQHVQQIVQSFWKRYSRDYLNNLQQRFKWQQRNRNLQVNDIVLIKDNNVAPCNWPFGRVIEVHIGNDGVVRVATVKTAQSIIKRPTSKLCRLPVGDDG